jgi:hypothetical protein
MRGAILDAIWRVEQRRPARVLRERAGGLSLWEALRISQHLFEVAFNGDHGVFRDLLAFDGCAPARQP